MYTRINIPAAVQNLNRSKSFVCRRPETVRWFKKSANKRQRRFFKQLMIEFVRDPDLYEEEGFRGMPRPLSNWDLD